MSEEQAIGPAITVVAGSPTDDELAAVVTAIIAIETTARQAEAARNAAPRPAWGDPSSALRKPLRHGVGGWRASALPRS